MTTSSTSRWMLGVVIAALAIFPACDDKSTPDPSEEQDEKKKKKKKKKSDEDDDGPKGKSGLAHPDNDEEVVALAKAAAKCDWERSGLKHDCKGHTAWTKSELFKNGKNDATLLNLIEDDDKAIRWLGGQSLDNYGARWQKDEKAAKRVLTAAKKEKDDAVADRLGRAVGRIDASATKLEGEITKLLEDSKSTPLRKSIVSSVLFNNRKKGGFYDLLQKMAREEKDKEVRKAAAAAFWTGGSERQEDTCKLWLELADDADGDLAGHSAYHCAFWSAGGGCQGQWDALLDTIEKRAKAGTVKSSFMTAALGYLQGQKNASDAQKKRALVIAEAVVANDKNDAAARGDALRIIGENDPGAKTVAAKYKDDKDFFVKNSAKRIIDGEIKLKKP